ncbi:MAG: hypothetical protein JNL08_16885 [Planctomycetes bacterium]|nr:hypothetical protein [Planctomycetota bacterium]
MLRFLMLTLCLCSLATAQRDRDGRPGPEPVRQLRHRIEALRERVRDHLQQQGDTPRERPADGAARDRRPRGQRDAGAARSRSGHRPPPRRGHDAGPRGADRRPDAVLRQRIQRLEGRLRHLRQLAGERPERHRRGGDGSRGPRGPRRPERSVDA